jgi:hypothetical protein
VLEASARAFLTGFNTAIRHPPDDRLANAVDALDPPLHGFAYEGAAMAAALVDLLTVSGGRTIRALLAGPALRYPHLVHVGAGWAFAKLGLRPGWAPSIAPDPLLRWLAWDGYGFHQGFFHADRVIGKRSVERGLTGDRRAVRDQGLGRSLWFHECADPEGVALRINQFPHRRRGDLWSGIGLAATYAGAATGAELQSVTVLAADHRADLAQGCVFGCVARRTSGLVPQHTLLAAEILAGASIDRAANWAEESRAAVGPAPYTSAHYQQWRAGIRDRWIAHQTASRPDTPFGHAATSA